MGQQIPFAKRIELARQNIRSKRSSALGFGMDVPFVDSMMYWPSTPRVPFDRAIGR